METKNINPTETNSEREIVMSRVFDAPRELVWEAWTNPAHVAKWWGPVGFSTTIETMDVQPGGVWSQVMHGPNGAEVPEQERLQGSHQAGTDCLFTRSRPGKRSQHHRPGHLDF